MTHEYVNIKDFLFAQKMSLWKQVKQQKRGGRKQTKIGKSNQTTAVDSAVVLVVVRLASA
jgi:hypothetical protein